MNTCDTCRWWFHGSEYLPDGFGYCTGSLVRKMGYYVPGHGYLPGDEDRNDQISGTGVSTGPKFGCIHHEPKGLQV